MKINEKSQKRFRIVRYMFVLAVCLVIAFCMNMATGNNYLALLVTLGIAMLLASFSDSWCFKLTDVLFGLEYEEYTPVKISNKDRIKMENQKKFVYYLERREMDQLIYCLKRDYMIG
jgi:hypothetical protein